MEPLTAHNSFGGSSIEHGARFGPITADPHREAVERVISEMGGTGLSLRDMADIAYLSPYHFARTFRRVTGIPPGEFQAAVRLQRAKRLLLTTDLSAGEICFEVGYGSLGTFTSRFTRLVGISPGRMRRLIEDAVAPPTNPSPPPTTLTGPGVAFEVVGPELPAGSRIHVGLFGSTIPQSLPVAGTVLTEFGPRRLCAVPDGLYHLMAAALPWTGDPVEFLLPGDSLRVGRGDRRILVRGGRSVGVAKVELRPARITDPPLLVALAGGTPSPQRAR